VPLWVRGTTQASSARDAVRLALIEGCDGNAEILCPPLRMHGNTSLLFYSNSCLDTTPHSAADCSWSICCCEEVYNHAVARLVFICVALLCVLTSDERLQCSQMG